MQEQFKSSKINSSYEWALNSSYLLSFFSGSLFSFYLLQSPQVIHLIPKKNNFQNWSTTIYFGSFPQFRSIAKPTKTIQFQSTSCSTQKLVRAPEMIKNGCSWSIFLEIRYSSYPPLWDCFKTKKCWLTPPTSCPAQKVVQGPEMTKNRCSLSLILPYTIGKPMEGRFQRVKKFDPSHSLLASSKNCYWAPKSPNIVVH